MAWHGARGFETAGVESTSRVSCYVRTSSSQFCLQFKLHGGMAGAGLP